MGVENRGWHVGEPGENPLKDAGEKELEAAAKGLTPEGKKWQKLAKGDSPLSEASDAELSAAAESLEHGKKHVEGGKGALAEAREAELAAAVERLSPQQDEENPLEKLVAKTEDKKSAKSKSDRKSDGRSHDQA